MLAAGYSASLRPLAAQLPQPVRGLVTGSIAAALQVAERAGPRGAPLADAAQRAFLHGMHSATLALASVSLVAAVVVLVLAPGRRVQQQPGGTGYVNRTPAAGLWRRVGALRLRYALLLSEPGGSVL